VGYAGYLVPLLLALYGVSAFVRPRIATGWPALIGLGLLVSSVTGILARASDTLAPFRIHRGGVIGWGASEALRVSVGTVGTWIILLALIPVGVLFVTQLSYGVLSRALGARLARVRSRRGSPAPEDLPRGAAVPPGGWPAVEAETIAPPLVVKEPGTTVTFALHNLEDRGTLFLGPGVPVYGGMIVGEHSRDNDLVVNPCKKKHLTNMRASTSDDTIRLSPHRNMSLEDCIEFLSDNELVEVTPKTIRLRKRLLGAHDRKREDRAAGEAQAS